MGSPVHGGRAFSLRSGQDFGAGARSGRDFTNSTGSDHPLDASCKGVGPEFEHHTFRG
jgi:hypothetical protein